MVISLALSLSTYSSGWHMLFSDLRIAERTDGRKDSRLYDAGRSLFMNHEGIGLLGFLCSTFSIFPLGPSLSVVCARAGTGIGKACEWMAEGSE